MAGTERTRLRSAWCAPGEERSKNIMKKSKLLAIPVLCLVLSLLLAVTAGACPDTPPPPPPPGDEGCTPGYWKNHLDGFLVAGDYYIVKGSVADNYYIIKLEGDYYIVKLGGDYYIVKLAGENAFNRLANDYYIVKLGTDYYIVKLAPEDIEALAEDYYIIKLANDYYIVKGEMDVPDRIELLAALKAKGPGSELVRHGAAAVLNALNQYVDYGLTMDEVAAYILAGDATPLVEANEQFCPLD
jgi:hypothetical protein